MNVNVHEVVIKQAKEHALRVFKEGKTVGLTCDNMRRLLQQLDKDPSSAYYGEGRSCYHDYVKTITETVDQIYAEHGMRIRYEVPKWGESTTFKIIFQPSR